ncbi:MAG: flavin reductase [Clostridia bacterium]|nr:flavin reductase [Clostridia bacterium]
MDNNAFFKIGYGLYVLTAHENEKDNGCIINTVMQVTDVPKRIAIAVNKNNLTCEMILRTGEFNVSVLAHGTEFDIFKRFGFQSGRETDKFVGFSGTKRAENGILYVEENTNAYFSVIVTETIDLGTHILFIGGASEAEVLSDKETVTYDFYQQNIKPKPDKNEKKGYRCKICGYVYEGETLPDDFVCPLCKHPASDFEKI